MSTTVADVVRVMEDAYPPAWADDWDTAIGLVVGDPEANVRRVHLAVDPTRAVVAEAIDSGADMLVVHHPLLFRPVSQVAATEPKGRVIHDLIRHGIALYVAHTNADSAPGGVSQSLAEAVGLAGIEPWDRSADDPDRGTGRLGRIPGGETLAAFVDRVNAALPRTSVGARVAGDPQASVETVALVGGAGDFMLDAAREAGVDVFLTSDLRHHPASELREYADAPALVDVPHFAAEWTWLPSLERLLRRALDPSVETQVSTLCTDPWNYRAPNPAPEN